MPTMPLINTSAYLQRIPEFGLVPTPKEVGANLGSVKIIVKDATALTVWGTAVAENPEIPRCPEVPFRSASNHRSSSEAGGTVP